MTRIEAEEAIMEKLKEIREIAFKYAPENDHISMCIIKDHLSVINHAKDAGTKLDAWINLSDGEGMYSVPLWEAPNAKG